LTERNIITSLKQSGDWVKYTNWAMLLQSYGI